MGDTVAGVAGDSAFVALGQRAQVARMRALASQALRCFPVSVVRLGLLEHGFNTTFRIDTATGEKFALRINVNSRRTTQNIAAELQWIEALARESDLVVATPVLTHDGELMTSVYSPECGRDLHVALFGWLGGRDLSAAPTLEKSRAAGRAMAVLHGHGAGFSPSDGAIMPLLDKPFWTSPDHLTPRNLGLGDGDLAVLRTVVERASVVMRRLFDSGAPQPIHADLHHRNMKWYRGQLSIFDFDDCGVGLPIQDLAVTTFYFRPNREHVHALLDGYASRRSIPGCPAEDFETLVAHRGLLLLNDLLATTNAGYRRLIPAYVHNTVVKLRNFLDTGVYRHDVDDLLPLR